MPRRRTHYDTFQGARVEREVWMGRRVALLTERIDERAGGEPGAGSAPGGRTADPARIDERAGGERGAGSAPGGRTADPARTDLDEATVTRILDALDRGADFYAEATGREPKPKHSIDGRITIAEVAGIGGAAWAWLGETGIEIQPEYLDVLVRGVREHGLFDQPLFYELGRNYWHYEGRLDLHPGTVATGYAVFLRFLAMDAAGVRGLPYRDWPFDEFRAAVSRLLDVFVDAREHEWSEVLSETPIALHTFERRGSESITLSSADLVASLFDRLARRHGGVAFVKRFLAAADSLPRLHSHAGICDNLFRAACTATGADLTSEFAAWRWPVPLPVG